MKTPKQILFSWETTEYKHYNKTPVWYLLFFALVISLLGFTLLQKDYFGAITIAIIATLIFVFTLHRPQRIEVSLSNKGVHVGELDIPYTYIKHFWIVDEDFHKTLNLETNVYLNRLVIIELEDQDPEPIRDILSKYTTEEPAKESTPIQKLMHHLHL